MFMQIAIGAIGIGIVLMVGYIVVSQVRSALPDASTIQVANPCLGEIGGAGTTTCINGTGYDFTAPTVCGDVNLSGFNATELITCSNIGFETGTASVQVTVFAGFALVAVGIIVLAAFGLINIFK